MKMYQTRGARKEEGRRKEKKPYIRRGEILKTDRGERELIMRERKEVICRERVRKFSPLEEGRTTLSCCYVKGGGGKNRDGTGKQKSNKLCVLLVGGGGNDA